MASEDVAISVNNLSKTFKLPHEKHNSIKSIFVNIFRLGRKYELQKALQGINFEVKKGEFFGIVGSNGSGKSTLLKIIAGIYQPTKGEVKINGKLVPFIELGVGFNMELTGRENVYLNGALLGFSRKEIDGMYKEIVEFAELERFMDQKLKNYSSGMQVRLAFSIAIRAESDILVLDEVLAVGDAAFQSKCFDYFNKIKKQGTTVVFVSHDRVTLERFCTKGIHINKGEIIKSGNIQKVLKSYSNVVLEELDKGIDIKSTDVDFDARDKDSLYARINKVQTLNELNEQKQRFAYGSSIKVQFEVEIQRDITNPVLGLIIRQRNVEKPVFAKNTIIDGNRSTGSFKPGDKIISSITLPNVLNDGVYYIEPAIANETASITYDQIPAAAKFIINGSGNPYSVISSDQKIKLTKD